MDVLINNLISAAKTYDKKNSRCTNLLEGPMVKALIENIQSCGVSFQIWDKDGDYEYTSLMGNDKKKILKISKLSNCRPPTFASDVKKLWEVNIASVSLAEAFICAL